MRITTQLILLLLTTTFIACKTDKKDTPPIEKAVETTVVPAPSPIVEVNDSGQITVWGKTSTLEELSAVLLDSIIQMDAIPTSIPIKYGENTLMGVRSEIASTIDDVQQITQRLTNANIKIATKSFRQQQGTDCDKDETEKEDCAIIDLQYPSITKGPQFLKDSVNNWVSNYTLAMVTDKVETHKNKNYLEKTAELFFANREEFKGSVMYGAFVAESGTEILLHNGQYLSLAMSGYTYQGGAHGNNPAQMATFDINNGHKLTWDDITTDKKALSALAEQQFRAERKEIFEGGFEFDDLFPFKLADNFAIVTNGIYFHYVPYEVGPYSIGSTTFVLPFSTIGDLYQLPPLEKEHKEAAVIDKNIRKFYQWYDKFVNDEKRNIQYTSDNGKHLLLNKEKLNEYFANIKASKLVSDNYISREIATLTICANHWQQESLEEPASCLDYDRFLCTQDAISTLPAGTMIKSIFLNELDALAIIDNDDYSYKIRLKKVDKQWLIDNIYCE